MRASIIGRRNAIKLIVDALLRCRTRNAAGSFAAHRVRDHIDNQPDTDGGAGTGAGGTCACGGIRARVIKNDGFYVAAASRNQHHIDKADQKRFGCGLYGDGHGGGV